jgi:hypothetical protein
VNLPVAEVFWMLNITGLHTIVLASGRNERSREATEKWLRVKALDSYDKLYMRKADDFRSDDIVKQEILDEIIADYGKKPDMVFDDRKKVVDMWRRNGIWVFDCNQSGQEF